MMFVFFCQIQQSLLFKKYNIHHIYYPIQPGSQSFPNTFKKRLRISAKIVDEQDGEITFVPTNLSKDHLNTANSTKHLLNAGRGHQAPRKAARCLQKKVGQNIEDKKRDKRVRDRDPREGVIKEEKYPNTRKPSHRWVCGEFWNLRRQHNWKKKKRKKRKTHRIHA